MKPHNDLRRNFSRRDLERLRARNESTATRRRLLAERLAASNRTKESIGLAPAVSEIPTPPSPALKLPSVRLYHRSDPKTEVKLVPSAGASVEAIVDALFSRKNQVIMTWPDKLRRPLALTVAALLKAQSAEPRLRATVAYYPFSGGSSYGLQSIFLDEGDIAARYHKLIVGMDRSEYGTVDYKYAYLLKGLKSASEATVSSSGAVSRPSLREMMPIFHPKGERRAQQYESEDPGFLGEISSRRKLIKEVSAYRKEIASIDGAPIAILGLPEDIDDINSCFKTGSRLSAHCDLILADATAVPFGGDGAWLKRFRRLRHLAVTHESQPVVVVLTANPFIAKAAVEILNSSKRSGAPNRLAKTELHTFIKIVTNDFSAQTAAELTWKPVEVSVYLKEQQLSSFTNESLSLAADLRVAGYPEASDAITSGLTYIRNVACLPVALDVLRKHLDAMEGTGAISAYGAAPYRPLNVLALLKRASETSDTLGDRVLRFRDTVSKMIARYSDGSEVAELVRGLVERATKKANRTVIAFRDRIILHAFDAWLYEQEGVDHEKLEHKVLLTTSDALGSVLSAAARGAPIDTLLFVHPKSKDFRRIIMSPVLPNKLTLVGDAGSLGSLHALMSTVRELLSGDPARRVGAVLKGLNACKAQFGNFDFEKVIAPEFKPEMTLDFTVWDAGIDGYMGPIMEISTEDGYLLRLLPHADCVVLQDDETVPFKRTRASDVRRDDRIFVFTPDLHDRLESLLGPVQTSGATLLESYHKAIHDRVALIPGSKREQARKIVSRIKAVAEQKGDSADLGVHEVGNVMRWISAGRVGGRPDAPRSQKAFGLLMAALEIPETIAAQYWHNAVVSTRVMAIQAGLYAHSRAQEFVLNPEAFFVRYSQAKPELRQLWEEMVRSANVVVDVNFVRSEKNLEDATQASSILRSVFCIGRAAIPAKRMETAVFTKLRYRSRWHQPTL
jgi:hypothetical protein